MTYPAALHFTTRPASAPGAGTVVFVHGSLDRGDSFRLAMRRLPEFSTLAYDRRGYQGSRDGGVVDLGGHIDDLLAVAETARAEARRSGGGHRAQPRGQRRARRRTVLPRGLRLHRGVRAAHALAGLPPPGWDPVAPAVRRPRRGGRTLLQPDGGRGDVGPPDRGGPGPATGRRSRAGGRHARHAGRGPSLRRHRARTCPRCSAGAARRQPPITDGRSNGWATTSPVRSSTRSPTRSTAPTCRTPTTSPRWRAS